MSQVEKATDLHEKIEEIITSIQTFQDKVKGAENPASATEEFCEELKKVLVFLQVAVMRESSERDLEEWHQAKKNLDRLLEEIL